MMENYILINSEVRKAFEHEFTCYYHADLLPVNWTEPSYLEESAKSTIDRLILKLDKKQLFQIISELIQNREHELNHLTSEVCDFEWVIEDQEWDDYILLLNSMLDHLQCTIRSTDNPPY